VAPPNAFIESQLDLTRRQSKGVALFKLGIDLGGTKIEGIVLDEDGKECFRDRIPTQQEEGYRHILNNVKCMYDRLNSEIAHREHTFGIGTPGALSPRTGRLKNSNTQCMNGMRVKIDLETLMKRPVGLQNDANCFAMAEALHGAGVGAEMVFGVIIGTGCGGGIVYKGQVLDGPQAITGEWGHMSIDPTGPECWCGSRGCVERFISGGGLEERYAEATHKTASAETIVKEFRKSNPEAVRVMELFFTQFGRAMANLINILDPNIIVLGGGLSNVDELYANGISEIRKFVFSDTFETPIVKHRLGDSAGVIGAALIGV